MSTFTKEEKGLMFFGLGILFVGLLFDYLQKKAIRQESGFVMPRGYFGSSTPSITPTPTLTPMPTPSPSPSPTPRPRPILTSPPIPMPTPTPTPTPPPSGQGSREIIGREPSQPTILPYPFPYPYPAYGVAPIQPYVIESPSTNVIGKQSCYKTVTIMGDTKPTCFATKNDYVNFLKKSYNTLVDSYNDALYSFSWGKALKINKIMKKVKNDVYNEIGIV